MKLISTELTDCKIPRRRPVAMTLIEILISMALISIVFVGVFLIVDKGMRFYRLNTDANDSQRGVLVFLSRLNSALQNSTPSLIFIDSPTPPGSGYGLYPDSRGIACATPFDNVGKSKFNIDRELYWQGYTCFYLDNDQQLRSLSRYYSQLSNPNSENINPPNPSMSVPPVVPASFLGSKQGFLIAKNVKKLTFTKHDKGELMANGHVNKNFFYDVSVECGKKGDPLGYWIQLQSSFYPRN